MIVTITYKIKIADCVFDRFLLVVKKDYNKMVARCASTSMTQTIYQMVFNL
jgi:hypothetical protein